MLGGSPLRPVGILRVLYVSYTFINIINRRRTGTTSGMLEVEPRRNRNVKATSRQKTQPKTGGVT